MGDRDRYQSYWDRDENRQRDDQSRNRGDEWRSRDRDWTSGRDYGGSNRDYNYGPSNRDYGSSNRDYGSGNRDYNYGSSNRDYNSGGNRDFNREYGRDTEHPYGSQYPERNYGQSFAGHESKRFPGTFGSYDDQRSGRDWNRDRSSESERNYGYGSPYGAGRESRSDYYASPYGGGDRPSYSERYGRESRDYGYGGQRDESFGHQLREAGQRFMGKVKRAFRGPKGYKRSDDRIREDVNDRLSMQDELDPSEIEVSVSNGEVTLTGKVETRKIIGEKERN